MKVGEYRKVKTREIIEDTIRQLVAVGLTPRRRGCTARRAGNDPNRGSQ